MKLCKLNCMIFRLLVVIVFVLMIVLSVFYDTSHAADSKKQTLVSQRTLHFLTNDEEQADSFSLQFCTNRRMVFMIPIKVTVSTIDYSDNHLDDDIENEFDGGIRIVLKNDQGIVLQNDYINLDGYKDEENYEGWFYSDGFLQDAGTYTYTIMCDATYDCDVKCSVVGFSQLANKAKLKKKVSKRSGNWVRIGEISGGLPYAKKFTTSNRKAVPYIDVDKNGRVYAYAKAKGKAKISVFLNNGKKYSSRITVKPGDPNMMAYVYDYATRNNYFVVKVKNNGPRSITIIRNGNKIENVDYKAYDRYIKGGNVKIKPGKTKYVRFYIRGSNTWYDSSDYTLYSKIKYEGKTYEWHVWDDDSVYKKNKKWYSTYWDEAAYGKWLGAE